jgi:hypothetical protein
VNGSGNQIQIHGECQKKELQIDSTTIVQLILKEEHDNLCLDLHVMHNEHLNSIKFADKSHNRQAYEDFPLGKLLTV